MNYRLAAGLLLLAAPAAPGAAQSAPERLTVFAASSLTEAFREIGLDFERREGAVVRFNFAGSQQLAAQIDLGGGADVFAPASDRWTRPLERRSLLDASPRTCVRNTLVVILPADNPGRIRELADLAHPGVRLVLPGPAVPAGEYSRRAIALLGSTPGWPPDYEQRVLANIRSNEDNVRGVLGKVLLGEADAGIVYRSDLTSPSAAPLAWLEFPPAARVMASYPLAALTSSANLTLARRFVHFVCSPEGRAILARHGFLDGGP